MDTLRSPEFASGQSGYFHNLLILFESAVEREGLEPDSILLNSFTIFYFLNFHTINRYHQSGELKQDGLRLLEPTRVRSGSPEPRRISTSPAYGLGDSRQRQTD